MNKDLRTLVGLTALLALTVFIADRTPKRHGWESMSEERRLRIWMRHLPSIQHYLSRKLGLPYDRSLGFDVNVAGMRENFASAGGVLFSDRTPLGSVNVRFFYSNRSVEPESVEMIIVLDKGRWPDFHDGELNSLVDELRQGRSGSVSHGSVQWRAYLGKGGPEMALSTKLPGEAIEWIPDYDRGGADAFEYTTRIPAMRFMRREALDPKVRTLFCAPIYNPPSASRSLGGRGYGFLLREDVAVAFEAYGGDDGRQSVYVLGSTNEAVPDQFFKKMFLAYVRAEARYKDGASIGAGHTYGFQSVEVDFPLGADLDKLKLEDFHAVAEGR